MELLVLSLPTDLTIDETTAESRLVVITRSLLHVVARLKEGTGSGSGSRHVELDFSLLTKMT